MEIKIICCKTGIPTICKEVKRKIKERIFPKWWCANCRRYVLPDGKWHSTYIWPGGKNE